MIRKLFRLDDEKERRRWTFISTVTILVCVVYWLKTNQLSNLASLIKLAFLEK